MDDYELIDNREDHQYEFHIGKLIPKIEYIKIKREKSISHIRRFRFNWKEKVLGANWSKKC